MPSRATRDAVSAVRSGEAEDPSHSGVVVLLFTDLVGSTEMLGRLGDDVAERMRREHFHLLRDVISGHRGTEVKNLGDGLMVVFAGVVDAISCAVAIQQAIARNNARTRESPMQVRIGLNAGEPFRTEDDWFGTPVVVAKRLCDQTEGGRIVVSQLVRDLAGGRGGFTFRELGPLVLRGLGAPVVAAEVEWAEPDRPLPLPDPLVEKDATPLVGREGELARLRAAWEQSRIGRPRVVLLAGDPGIGKTRLAAEFCRAAHADERAAVLLGRCQEELRAAHQPFIEAFERYVGAASIDELRLQVGDDRALIARLVPAVERHLPGGAASPAADPEAERYRLFGAVARLLREAARARPAIFLLDDVHWADEPSLQLLVHVVRELGDAPLLVIGTYRATEVEPALGDALAALRRLRATEEIALGGLDRDEVAALVRARTGADPRDAADEVLARTEGNPFFIEELLREPSAEGVPSSVEDLIRRRLARLDEPAAR